MIFNSANRDDLFRYYRQTFVKFKEFGDELFFIQNIDRFKVTGDHQDGDQFTMYLNDETPYEVEYILPHKSFFQHGPDAVQLCRIPAKQYYRGLCASNTQLSYFVTGIGMKTLPLEFNILKAFVGKKKFMSLSEAVQLATSHNTVALSPRFMINVKNGNLYVDFIPIGKVSRPRGIVSVTRHVFYDDVVELLRGDYNWKVEKYIPTPKERTSTEDLLKEMGQPVKKVTKKLPFPDQIHPVPMAFFDEEAE